ncbi:tautomerase family protein [Cellulomonas carbonis]|uniref:4-oxalocrotonate tautomerase n=1 Tax=Cellulomonas carbonis T26 TaxID=947969 RepID=A0A0A0BSB8_9CELL|nr:tautomerase family protein [Cellulomonas carbonis]KGM10846.1 4-oxalocrotonate tautomerase [Cellulomonas carbonis T26]GGB92373.1 tautomerase [Cellulomonas carbonis]
MAQVKVYGRRSVWAGRLTEVSDAVHAAVVGAWEIPEPKRFHRFLLLEDDELVAPGRGPAYLLVEVVCFTGRSPEAVRRLLRALMDGVAPALGLGVDDLEVVVVEVPPSRWGIRGRTGDELELDYRVDV